MYITFLNLDMSSILTIESYRKCRDLTLELEYGTMILIEGPSGAGKTTIIEAIRWVLYGNISHIQDIFSNTRTSVKLEANGLQIHRTTRPHNLIVEKEKEEKEKEEKEKEEKEKEKEKETTYTGVSAQTLIDEIFGKKEIFDLAAYMRQDDTPCPMLNVSNSVRLYYLTQLCFEQGDSSPETILDAIYHTMKEVETQYHTELREYEALVSRFSAKLETRPVDINIKEYINKYGSNKGTHMAEENLITTKSYRDQIKQILAISETEKVELTHITKERDNIIEIIKEKVEISESQIGEIELKILEIEEMIYKIREALLKTDIELDRLNIIKNKRDIYDKQEDRRTHIMKIILDLENRLSMPDKPMTHRHLYELETKIEQYNNNKRILERCTSILHVNYNIKELEDVLIHLREDIKSMDIYKCPKCSVNLLIRNGDLNVTTEKAKTKDIDVTSVKVDINNITKVINNFVDKPDRQIDELKNILEYQELHEELTQLNLHPILVEDVTHKITQLHNEKKQCNQALHNNLETQKIHKDAVLQLKSEQAAYISKQEQCNRQLDWFNTRIEKLTRTAYSKTDEDLQLINIEVGKAEDKIYDTVYAIEMLETHAQLDVIRLKLVTKATDLSDLVSLYNTAFNTYYDRLRGAADRINQALYKNTEYLFNFPLTVQINLDKKIKKSGRLQPAVGLDVIYKGKECNPFYHLSYGQRKRLSLLLSMAINTLTKTPIVLYDEILTNVDMPTRDRCLTAIRDTVRPDRVIICAELHGEDREYDNIIKLDDEM